MRFGRLSYSVGALMMGLVFIFVAGYHYAQPLRAQSFGPHTEGVYQNTPPTLVQVGQTSDRYIMQRVRKVGLDGGTDGIAKVTSITLSVEGNNHSLESKDLRVGCWVSALPLNSSLPDPASFEPANPTTFLWAQLFRAPSTQLTWGTKHFEDPYFLSASEELYVIAQVRNTGPVDLEHVMCVVQVDYKVEG